jgi:hypothetical protein
MSAHNPVSDDGANDESAANALRVALSDLAAAMPDDPHRVERIHARARRLRSRRRARRVTAMAASGAALIATLVAVRSSTLHVSNQPAAAEPASVEASPPPTAPPSSVASAPAMPTCAAALAAVAPGAPAPPKPSTGSLPAEAGPDPPADAAKQATADAADAANHAIDGVRGIKGKGTIAAADETSVTITVDPSDPAAPPEITATIATDIEYLDGDTMVDAQPALHTGDRVFFATKQADDDSYQLIYLQVHPTEADVDPDATVDPKDKAARAGDDSGDIKGSATVTGVDADSITVTLADGPLAGRELSAAIGPNTVYTVGTQRCVEPELATGTTVSVLLHRDRDTYTARQIDLFRN